MFPRLDGVNPTSTTATAWQRTPWHATRRAAWEALQAMEKAS